MCVEIPDKYDYGSSLQEDVWVWLYSESSFAAEAEALRGLGCRWEDGLARPAYLDLLPWRAEPVTQADVEKLGCKPCDEPLEPAKSYHQLFLPERSNGWSTTESTESVPGLTNCPSLDSESSRVILERPNQQEISLTGINVCNMDPPLLMHMGLGFLESFSTDPLYGIPIGKPEDDPSAYLPGLPLDTVHSVKRPSSCGSVSDYTPESSSEPSDENASDVESVWMSDYSESVLTLESGHPFLEVKHAVIEKALFLFYTQKLHDGDGNSQRVVGEAQRHPRSSETSDPGRQSGRKGKKRALGSDRSQDEEDDDDSKHPIKRRKAARQKGSRRVSLACPFAKKDPLRYAGCNSYTLNRTQDVKQHLSRYHQLPIYCPRCKETFQTETERDSHAMDTTCQRRSSITFEGVTRAQKEELTRRVSPKMALEDQWFAIFDILFPGHTPRPTSAYINTGLTADVEAFQNLMRTIGPSIILSTLEQHGIELSNIANEERDLGVLQEVAIAEGLQTIAQVWTTLSMLRPGNSEDTHADGSGISATSRPFTGSQRSGTSSSTLIDTGVDLLSTPLGLNSIAEQTTLHHGSRTQRLAEVIQWHADLYYAKQGAMPVELSADPPREPETSDPNIHSNIFGDTEFDFSSMFELEQAASSPNVPTPAQRHGDPLTTHNVEENTENTALLQLSRDYQVQNTAWHQDESS